MLECKGANEEYSICADVCERKCKKYPGEKCTLADVLYKFCKIGCTCKERHARITDYKCVPIDSAECGGVHDPLGLKDDISFPSKWYKNESSNFNQQNK